MKEVGVVFIDNKIKKAYDKLKIENPDLHRFIDRATDDLKLNPFCGIPIQKKLIPKIYIKKYNIDNLWKYDLPGGWRLIYAVVGSEIKIISAVIEWFNHKNYERRFGYK